MTLRISVSYQGDQAVFTLSGRIQADQVRELQTLLVSESLDHHPVLELRDVKLVDREAVDFLARIEAEGARLRNCSAFIRQWISQEQNRVGHTVKERREI